MNSLPVQQKSNLLLSPNVIEEVKNDVFNVVKAGIAQCYAHLNLAVPGDDDRSYLVNEVTDTIIQNYPSLRLQEISIAFSNGIRKKYGEYFGLCVVSFEQFITGYLNSPERAELVKETTKLVEVKTEPTAEEKRFLRWSNMLNAWAAYKKDGSFNDHGNSVYTTLVNNGRLKYPREKVVEFLGKALTEVKIQYNPLIHVGNPIKAQEFKAIIQELDTRGKTNSRVKVAARKIILNHFFSELLEMEIEVTDLFN